MLEAPDDMTLQHIARRNRILDKLLAAAADGHEEPGMREVAQRAGVAVCTLYRYFPSKEHMLVSVLGRWLENFEQRADAKLYSIDDPHERLWRVVEQVHDGVCRRPLLAKAMARTYTAADASVALEVETVRSQLVDLFADAVSRGVPTESHMDVAGLLADVLATNLLALAHGRASKADIHRRLRLTVDLFVKRHGEAIGSPDWHGTRSACARSPRWFQDWTSHAPGTTGHRVRS